MNDAAAQNNTIIDESELQFKTVAECSDYDGISVAIKASSDKRLLRRELQFKFFGPPSKSVNDISSQRNGLEVDFQHDLYIYNLANITSSTIVEDDILNSQIDLTEIHRSAISLRLSDCIIPTSCLVKGVSQSVISLGFGDSISLENVENLIFIINCHQLRIKNADNCIVIANVKSQDAIVEGCNKLKTGSPHGSNGVKPPLYSVNDLNWPTRNEVNPYVSGVERQYNSLESLISAHFDLDLQIVLKSKLTAIKSRYQF